MILQRVLAALSLCFMAMNCFAQQPVLDGNWIKESIDAFERVHVSRTSSDPDKDSAKSTELFMYLGGVLAVHRQNNMNATLLNAALNKLPSSQQKDVDKQMRVAFAFTPLLGIPDQLSPQQIVAVLRRYLETNPDKWSNGAALMIEDAFKQAFLKK